MSNNLKHQNLEQRKVYCRAKQGERGGSCSKDLKSLTVFREEFLKAEFGVRAAGCGTFFWLVGDEVTRWCSRTCAQLEVTILHLGGSLSSCRRIQIYVVMYIPRGGSRTQEDFISGIKHKTSLKNLDIGWKSMSVKKNGSLQRMGNGITVELIKYRYAKTSIPKILIQ